MDLDIVPFRSEGACEVVKKASVMRAERENLVINHIFIFMSMLIASLCFVSRRVGDRLSGEGGRCGEIAMITD
jgi:hypothetical protein